MVETEKEKIKREKAAIYLNKLKEKLTYYKQNVINSSDAIIVQDFNGTIKAWNHGAERIYGFKEKEMLGKNITGIIAREYRAEARKNIRAIKYGKPTFKVRQIRETKNKQKVFVNITYSPIFENEEIIEVGTSEEDISQLKKSLEKLKESESQFRELFDNMDEAVAIYEIKNNGKDVIIKDFNKAAEKLEGVKKESIIGKKVDNVFKGVKEIGLYDVFKKVWRTGEPMQHPISFYKDKYHQGWRENYILKLPHDGIVAIYSDVTKRKEIEKALRESEEKYQNVAEKANDGIVIVQDLIIKYGNSYLEKIRGDSLKNIINHKFLEFIAPEELEKIKTYYKKRISGEKVPPRYETILLRKDGKKIWVELNAGIIQYEGKPADLVIIRDITERKETEEKKYKTLVNSIEQGLYSTKGGKFLEVNKGMEDMFGYSREELTKMYAWELAKPEIREIVKEKFFAKVRNKDYNSELIECIKKNGDSLFVEISMNKPTEGGVVSGLVTNITEKKEAEMMKMEFLSAISHELRTPITPIKAQLQRMLSTDLEKKEQTNSLEIALRNTIRMDRLIQDLLEISRIKSGKFNIFKRKENLNEIISEAITDLNSFAKERNAVITFERGEIPRTNIDKDRILEVIINIIDNAIRYGKGKISIETKKEGKDVLIKIKDNGTGIAKSEIVNIFTPFYKGKRLKEQKYEGTGLGLSICRGIIEAHNGKIWLESQIGKGTTFFIKMPLSKI